DQLRNAVGHHAPGGRDILVGRGPTHQHEHFRAEGRRLVHRAPILLDPRRSLVGCGRRKHPAAAHARHTDSGVAQQTRRRLHAHVGELMAPHGDVRHAVPGTGVDDLLERRSLGGDLVEAESGDRRGPRHSSPASASTRRIRSTARSWSTSSPAASASWNSSARCGTERQLSAPPSMRKCGWWPFRYARNTTPVLYAYVGGWKMWRDSATLGASARRYPATSPRSKACSAADAAGAIASKIPSSASLCR